MSRGEVGREGVAVSSLEDMEALFDGIPLDQVTTSMTINATASVALAMYVAIADKRRRIIACILIGILIVLAVPAFF